MIIVTGGTGRLGAGIVERLLTRVPADRVGVSVRDPERAGDLAARGVRVRRGDFTDPASLAAAFEGATQVLIVSTNQTGEAALAQHVAAVDAAYRAGAGRILYASHQGAAADSLFAPMPNHAATERHLAGAGTPFTALRNGFYAGTVEHLLGRALQTGDLVAPADGPVSWTAHADLAEAAAVILAEDGAFDGPTPPLTAPVALDLEDVAGILTDLTGRPVRRVVAGDEEWVASLTAHGVPAAQADLLLGMFHASRRGEFASTGTDLERLIGRPATTLREVLAPVVAAR
ncbi:NmrA family NAD(P)-binding protein [Dactylosporangium aurantiacum]|uniref:NmrA family NAD(P)-binding protein n=1 Tax=Dactylosporangium aurantiacum TaxID=35754 RepID=A0A9Q9MAS9_9ACTN|nr:NAD(P)H-binding protein [Dactylosporangium aurantiacum]MDG6108882.1 NAD(P)H-binding protein [Dactylosporangium aurantiacum]UWZ52178.1 NmrA family NAD(P)-binding protein [Dactylosporangium aurantiacum]